MLLGILSDTHGLLRPEALLALQGVDLILHAGDVGSPEILVRLAEIAPVFAVRGNVDTEAWAEQLPVDAVVEAGGASFYLLHNLRELSLKPEASGFQAVIYGHTHQPEHHYRKGVLYLNPGSAGPRRFRLPVTLVKLKLGARPWAIEFVPLLPD